MRIFISGGCKNGKSTWAETLAIAQRRPGRPLYYVATMEPHDGEDEARIARHRAERAGKGFTTLEIPRSPAAGLAPYAADSSFLLDSVTALLSNEMFAGGHADSAAADRLAAQLEAVLRQYPDLILVSDYIYSDALPYDETTLLYRKALARLDRLCAAACDAVLEVCVGALLCHKGLPSLRAQIPGLPLSPAGPAAATNPPSSFLSIPVAGPGPSSPL